MWSFLRRCSICAYDTPARSAEAGANPVRSRHCESAPEEPKARPVLRVTLPYPIIGARNPWRTSIMTDAVFTPATEPVAIPLRELMPWIIFGGLIMLLAIYFVGAEEGATSIVPGMYVHEFVHDGRHLLGFPCH
jgi:hypothetical protein